MTTTTCRTARKPSPSSISGVASAAPFLTSCNCLRYVGKVTLDELKTDLLREQGRFPVDWQRLDSLWRDLSQEAERLLTSVATEAFCTAQEWDRRIDCGIRLPDGKVVAEMVSLRRLTERRIREAGERLQKKAAGKTVRLKDERCPPIRIRVGR
jgi:hypothetical protein